MVTVLNQLSCVVRSPGYRTKLDRRVFLRSKGWLRPISDDAWPPSSRGGTSEVILRDCSCCFHLGDKLCFFAAQPKQDATEMPFEMALVTTLVHDHSSGHPPSSVSSSLTDDGQMHSTPVVALFFRVSMDIYLVNHTAIQKCVCPSDPRTVAPTDQAPPFASFSFPNGTLRFWMAQLSLSPVNAIQPLRDAMEKMNVKLQRQVLSLEEYEGPSGTGEEDPDLVLQGIEQDGQAALLAVEDMLSGVETILHPPGTPWQPEEVNFLLTQSGKLLAKGLCRGSCRWEKQLDDMEVGLDQQLQEVLGRMFPKNPADVQSQEEAHAWLGHVEALSDTLKRVKRARVLCGLRIGLPPAGPVSSDSGMTGGKD